ncbi:MAG: hypothetical protein ACTHKQ_08680, partial [Mesorhizobium sp.]
SAASAPVIDSATGAAPRAGRFDASDDGRFLRLESDRPDRADTGTCQAKAGAFPLTLAQTDHRSLPPFQNVAYHNN